MYWLGVGFITAFVIFHIIFEFPEFFFFLMSLQ